MKTIIATAFLLSTITSANAGHVGSCSWSRDTLSCAGGYVSAEPRIIHRDSFNEAEDARWLVFCEPTLSRPDDLGVQHYLYTYEGCEYGRTR